MKPQPQGSVPPSGKETVDALADEWGKLMAISMYKLGLTELVITADDIDKACGADGAMEKTLVVQELKAGLHIKLMATAEAIEFSKKHKGGFGRS